MTYGLTSRSSTRKRSDRSVVELEARLLVEGAEGVGAGAAEGAIEEKWIVYKFQRSAVTRICIHRDVVEIRRKLESRS